MFKSIKKLSLGLVGIGAVVLSSAVPSHAALDTAGFTIDTTALNGLLILGLPALAAIATWGYIKLGAKKA